MILYFLAHHSLYQVLLGEEVANQSSLENNSSFEYENNHHHHTNGDGGVGDYNNDNSNSNSHNDDTTEFGQQQTRKSSQVAILELLFLNCSFKPDIFVLLIS